MKKVKCLVANIEKAQRRVKRAVKRYEKALRPLWYFDKGCERSVHAAIVYFRNDGSPCLRGYATKLTRDFYRRKANGICYIKGGYNPDDWSQDCKKIKELQRAIDAAEENLDQLFYELKLLGYDNAKIFC